MTFSSTLGADGWEVEPIDLPPARTSTDASGNTVLLGEDGVSIPLRRTSAPLTVVGLGLSLIDQGRSPSYTTNVDTNGNPGTLVRWITGADIMGWIARLSGGLRQNVNAGKSGDTVAGSLARIDEVLLLDPKPDICYLWNGGNDINGVGSSAAVAPLLVTMEADYRTTITKLQSAGIEVWMMALPFNATWQSIPYRMGMFSAWGNIERKICEEMGVLYLPADVLMGRPVKSPVVTSASVTASAGVATATWVGHPFVAGDYVMATSSGNVLFNTALPPPLVTVVNADTIQYAVAATSGSSTSTIQRMDIYPQLSSDGSTHISDRGALRIARHLYNTVLKDVIKRRDTLCNYQRDYTNIVGANTAAGGTEINLSVMTGTTGTRSGTAVSHTGNVPIGWTANVIAGNPTAIVHSSVARTDEGFTHRNWHQISIQSGGSDAQLEFYVDHTLPATFANGVIGAGSWRIPTVPNGFFYYTAAGGTASTGEPVWPTVLAGEIAKDGINWECRQGWQVDDLMALEGEYRVVSVTDTATIECVSFGIVDTTLGANDLKDVHFANVTDDKNAEQAANDHFVSRPPIGAIVAANTLRFGWKIRVRGGSKTAVLQFDRPTWRKA